MKFKFVETASFIVTAINQKRSVALALLDGDIRIPANPHFPDLRPGRTAVSGAYAGLLKQVKARVESGGR